MKKFLAVLLVLTLAISLLAGCGKKDDATTGGDGAATGETVKIGIITPMTGDNSVYGKQMTAGFNLCFDAVNEAGGVLGGKKIVMEVFDDKEDPAESPMGASKFIADDSVCAVIGAHNSGNSLAIVNQLQEAGMLMLNCSSSSLDLLKYDNFFRVVSSSKDQATFVANWIASEHKNIGVIAANNDWGKDNLKFFTEAFEAAGGTINLVESIDPTATDFRSALTRIAATKPEAIFMMTTYGGSPLIIQQGQELGLDMPWYGMPGLMENELLTAGGDSVEGIRFFTEFFPDDPNPSVVAFNEKYMAKHGEAPGLQAALAYDVATMFVELLEKAGSADRQALLDAAKDFSFQGITNLYQYDGNILAVKDYTKVTVKDGKFTVVA